MEFGVGSILFILACVWWICKTIEDAARPKDPPTEREEQMTDVEYQIEIDRRTFEILDEAEREAKRRKQDQDPPGQRGTNP